MTTEVDLLQLRTGRRLATISLAGAALSALAISAVLGIAAFIRAGDGGITRPAMIKWTFALSMLFVLPLIWFLIAFLGFLPLT